MARSAFKMKSGNSPLFKQMGSSPARNMKTGNYNQSFEAPVKQKSTKSSEGQDQNKILNDKGVHVGNYVNDKKVMFTQDQIEDAAAVTTNIKMPKVMNDGSKNTVHTKDGEVKNWQPHQFRKKESPIEQTDSTWVDGSKKSKRQVSEQTIHPSEYWYKINGKKATKAQYMNYQNKPGGDEKGKQTNDPNASLAKQSGDKRK